MDMLSGREIIFEFRAGGISVQVSAIDCATGTEVSVITPKNTARADQQALVLRKLAKALRDDGILEMRTAQIEKGDTPNVVPPSSKRGFLA